VSEPEVFGKYVLLERLAAGGMGEVFLARSGAKGFEKFFALKRILAQHADSPEFVQMLLNEARISVMLVHPNIAQVFEFGQIDASFFMALEFVEGLSLNGILRRGREQRKSMRPADAVWVALQVCRALHYAHNKRDNDGNDLKIVHRDISPHNILVDETGSVKLIDFGIAKAAQGQIQTEASTIKGKIPYMSPEQASGQPIDRRSDLYSLGIVLYECLTLERMYPAGNTFETFALVRLGKVPDLDEKLGARVPASLLALMKKALQKEPDARYQTAAELESDLSRILHELDPGHTSYMLADLVAALDDERDTRKQKLKSWSKISPEDILRARPPGAAALPPVVTGEGKLLAPPLPVDVTLGSMAIATAVSQLKTVQSKPKLDAAGADEVISAMDAMNAMNARRARVPLLLGGGAMVVALVALAFVVLRDNPSTGATVTPVVAPVVTPPVVAAVVVDAGVAIEKPSETHVEKPVEKPVEKLVEKPVVKKTTKKDGKSAAKGTGCVAINVKPWAYVSEKGKRLGQTPMPCLSLSAGKHTLTLENPVVGKSRTVDVVVTADETVRVIETL
jgi:serine/threonine protein kinase